MRLRETAGEMVSGAGARSAGEAELGAGARSANLAELDGWMLSERSRAFLAEVRKKGDILGLQTVRNLFAELGEPQESLHAIQVVGTNGKGSVCRYLASVLQEAGYHVGVYTSPAVFSYAERFEVDGAPISASRFEELLGEVERAYRRMEEKRLALPTIFEIETAVAVLYFLREGCDPVILEAGMGGDLDATNLFAKPLLAVFTSIGMDHMQFLGDSVEEIAAHKAGILKEHETAVSAPQETAVRAVLEREAAARHAAIRFVKAEEITVRSRDPIVLDVGHWRGITLAMRGVFQVDNAATALAATDALREAGYSVSEEAVRAGMARAVRHGRMERLAVLGNERENSPATGARATEIWLDGAHNVLAALRLRETIEAQFGGRALTLVIGMLKDKAYEEVLSILVPLARQVVTVTPPTERALDSAILAETARQYGRDGTIVETAADFAEAVRLAREGEDGGEKPRSARDGVILVTGSLSILRGMRDAFLREYG